MKYTDMKTLAVLFALACTAFPGAAATRTWNGAVSSAWSNPANWDEGVAPANGDDLVFPQGSNVPSVNDLPAGLLVHSITINMNGSRISGNAIVLDAGGITVNNRFFVSIIIGMLQFSGITLNASQTWSGAEHAESVVLGQMNINGKTLTITGGSFSIAALTGTGSVIERGGAIGINSSTWNGPLTVTAGLVGLTGTAGDAQLDGGTLMLRGGAPGNVTITGGMLDVQNFGNNSPSRSGSINVIPSSGAPAIVRVETNGFNAVGDIVTGTIALNNAVLSLNNGGVIPGSTLTIFNNDGTDPVTGNFLGLPEGSIINSGGGSNQISYAGGTGNDVTLTALDTQIPSTATTLASSANPSLPNKPITLTATVTTSTGIVNFYDGSILLGASPLDASGRAALTVALPAGTHALTAAYTGTPSLATSQATLQQQVVPPRRRAL